MIKTAYLMNDKVVCLQCGDKWLSSCPTAFTVYKRGPLWAMTCAECSVVIDVGTRPKEIFEGKFTTQVFDWYQERIDKMIIDQDWEALGQLERRLVKSYTHALVRGNMERVDPMHIEMILDQIETAVNQSLQKYRGFSS